MNMWDKLSENYAVGELVRSDTAERKGIDNMPPDEYFSKLQRLAVEVLEPILKQYQIPFSPNSGYRSPELNAAVGGSNKSQHSKAEAVDISIRGISNFELAGWVQDNLQFDQLILECYRSGEPNSGWVHISLKPEGETNRLMAMTYSNKQYTQGLHA